MLKKNDEIELYIDDFTSEGSGVGRFENMAVFCTGAVKGDKVIVHIIKVKKTYAVAKTVKILNRSKNRCVSDCDFSASCGGCAFRELKYDSEIQMKKEKVENAFLRIGGIDKKVDELLGAEELQHYRNKAEYPVSFQNNRLNIGFYARHTHRIIDCDNCVLQPEIFSDIVKVVRKWIIEYGISVYDSESHKGLLRHIYIREGAVSKEIMFCLVINGDEIPKQDVLIERLKKFECIKSIVLNINKTKSNVILGTECKTVWGEDYIYDTLCGVKIRLSPLSFYQVNHEQAQCLYKKAGEYASLTGKETVLDMYCGAGTIGLSMHKNAKRLIGVEIIPEAVEDAKYNASLNDVKNAEFYCMDAAEASQKFAEENIKPDVIILDPPRKGCSEDLIKTVSGMSPDRIVYVSCDCATLARDCKIFKNSGYEVQKLSAVDLFPRTIHVETVVLMSKVGVEYA